MCILWWSLQVKDQIMFLFKDIISGIEGLSS